MWQFWAPGNPRSNGLHGVHHQGEPGSRGPRMGSVRLGLPTAGSPFWKQEVVSAEPNSLLDELHSTVFSVRGANFVSPRRIQNGNVPRTGTATQMWGTGSGTWKLQCWRLRGRQYHGQWGRTCLDPFDLHVESEM